MANRHSRTWPGKTVRVVLVDGQVLFAKFKDYHSQRTTFTHLVTREEFHIPNDRIRSFSIYKGEVASCTAAKTVAK